MQSENSKGCNPITIFNDQKHTKRKKNCLKMNISGVNDPCINLPSIKCN